MYPRSARNKHLHEDVGIFLLIHFWLISYSIYLYWSWVPENGVKKRWILILISLFPENWKSKKSVSSNSSLRPSCHPFLSCWALHLAILYSVLFLPTVWGTSHGIITFTSSLLSHLLPSLSGEHIQDFDTFNTVRFPLQPIVPLRAPLPLPWESQASRQKYSSFPLLSSISFDLDSLFKTPVKLRLLRSLKKETLTYFSQIFLWLHLTWPLGSVRFCETLLKLNSWIWNKNRNI